MLRIEAPIGKSLYIAFTQQAFAKSQSNQIFLDPNFDGTAEFPNTSWF